MRSVHGVPCVKSYYTFLIWLLPIKSKLHLIYPIKLSLLLLLYFLDRYLSFVSLLRPPLASIRNNNAFSLTGTFQHRNPLRVYIGLSFTSSIFIYTSFSFFILLPLYFFVISSLPFVCIPWFSWGMKTIGNTNCAVWEDARVTVRTKLEAASPKCSVEREKSLTPHLAREICRLFKNR